MTSPQMQAAISPATRAHVGSMLASAYNVALAASDGTAPALVGASAELLLSVGATIASQALAEIAGELADAIPIVGAVASTLIGIVSAVQQSEAADAEQRAAIFRAKCGAVRDLYTVRPTGYNGTTLPADLFLKSFRSEQTAAGDDVLTHTGRVPYPGGMLRLLTEYQWPAWIIERTVGAAPMHEYLGIPPATLAMYGGNGYSPEPCALPIWPNTELPPLFAELRQGIEDQSLARRQALGRPGGDAGRALWPLYMDLLWAYTSVQRRPLNVSESEAAELGLVDVAPMGEAFSRAMFGGAVLPAVLNTLHNAEVRAAMGAVELAGESGLYGPLRAAPGASQACARLWGHWHDLDAIAGQCHGLPNRTLDQLWTMIHAWGDTAHPLYPPDQDRVAAAIRDTVIYTDDYARRVLGVVGDAPTAGDAFERLEQLGAGAGSVRAGAGSGLGAAAAVALGAVGWYLLR